MTALGGAAVAYMVKFTLDRASIHAHAGSCCIMLDHAGSCWYMLYADSVCIQKPGALPGTELEEGTSPPLLE